MESPSAQDRRMREIRLVGRGGQGIVTAGDLLGRAAVLEGRHAQSIPTFGPERRGALSASTLRVSGTEILLKCSSVAPDVLLVIDPTIWHHINVLLGLKPDGTLILNSPRAPEEIAEDLREGRHGYTAAVDGLEILSVDATGIALKEIGRAIPNTAMMGALSGATGIIGMEAIETVLLDRFGKKGEVNVRSARAAIAELKALGD